MPLDCLPACLLAHEGCWRMRLVLLQHALVWLGVVVPAWWVCIPRENDGGKREKEKSRRNKVEVDLTHFVVMVVVV
jgi:hypothetical protein